MAIRKRMHIHVPLNSMRITAHQLHCLAMTLGVLSSDSPAGIQLIIEGKITKLGREPQNVQVIIEEGTPMAELHL